MIMVDKTRGPCTPVYTYLRRKWPIKSAARVEPQQSIQQTCADGFVCLHFHRSRAAASMPYRRASHTNEGPCPSSILHPDTIGQRNPVGVWIIRPVYYAPTRLTPHRHSRSLLSVCLPVSLRLDECATHIVAHRTRADLRHTGAIEYPLNRNKRCPKAGKPTRQWSSMASRQQQNAALANNQT